MPPTASRIPALSLVAPPALHRPAATVSVDVDPVDLHLAGRGYRSLPPDALVYDVALPRLLELFERCGVSATVFVVGRDATAHRRILTRLVLAGHEVASHSLTHPLGLASLNGESLRREFAESRWLLEETCGEPVVGFRAPQFDMDERVLDLLAESGYAYDASACPTPMLVSTRLAMLLRGGDLSGVLRLKALPFTWRREPHVRRRGSRAVHEFPLSVTPIERRPLHHSLRYSMGDRRFERLLRGFERRGEPVSYLLHAVDALGFAEDRVDPRLAGYTGIRLPLARKLDLLERTFRAITARFESRPFRDRLTAV